MGLTSCAQSLSGRMHAYKLACGSIIAFEPLGVNNFNVDFTLLSITVGVKWISLWQVGSHAWGEFSRNLSKELPGRLDSWLSR